MKAPRCRLCGKEHYGLCKEAAKSVGRREKSRSSNVSPVDLSLRVNPAPSSAPSVSSLGSVKSRIAADSSVAPLADTSTSDGLTSTGETIPEMFERKVAGLGFKKLTPAERQKLWRTAGDVEGKREANRLRMAVRRKELKDV